jgi:hypothetical protein
MMKRQITFLAIALMAASAFGVTDDFDGTDPDLSWFVTYDGTNGELWPGGGTPASGPLPSDDPYFSVGFGGTMDLVGASTAVEFVAAIPGVTDEYYQFTQTVYGPTATVTAKVDANNLSEPAVISFMDGNLSCYGMGYAPHDSEDPDHGDEVTLFAMDPTGGFNYMKLAAIDVSAYGDLDYQCEFELRTSYDSVSEKTTIFGIAKKVSTGQTIAVLSYLAGGTVDPSYALDASGEETTATAGNVPVLMGGAFALAVQPHSDDVANASFDDFELVNTVAALPMQGDFDADGDVDVTDLGILATNYGDDDVTWGTGDSDFDGDCDVSDLGNLATNYGTSSAGAPVNVPEPTTMGLLAVGGVLALIRRRK